MSLSVKKPQGAKKDQGRRPNTRDRISHNKQTRTSKHENEPSDPCVECNILIFEGDDAIKCDYCDNWFCFSCTNVPDKRTYKAIAEDEGIVWFCIHCRTSLPGLKKMVCRVAKLEQTQLEILETLKELKNGTSTSSNQLVGSIEDQVQEALQEEREIKSRKLNIMCFGIEESTGSSSEM
jgi:hypothetical protein